MKERYLSVGKGSTSDELYETFLFESPRHVSSNPQNYEILSRYIKEIPNDQIQNVGQGYKKFDDNTNVFYWYENAGEILLAVQFSKKPKALVVNTVAKHPGATLKSPFASDLYAHVLKDYGTFVIQSDEMLSDQGFGIWKNLLAKGHKISVIDYTDDLPPVSVTSIEELEKYFGNDPTLSKYRYIVSENALKENTCKYLFEIFYIKEISLRKTI